METSSKLNFQKFSNIDAILVFDYNVSWEASFQTPAEQKLRTNKLDRFFKELECKMLFLVFCLNMACIHRKTFQLS